MPGGLFRFFLSMCRVRNSNSRHVSGYAFEILPNRKLLGTDRFAFAAFSALVSPCFGLGVAVVSAFCSCFTAVSCVFVPDIEHSWNIYTERTGHAVGTAGTAILCAALYGIGNPGYDSLFFFVQRNKLSKGP